MSPPTTSSGDFHDIFLLLSYAIPFANLLWIISSKVHDEIDFNLVSDKHFRESR